MPTANEIAMLRAARAADITSRDELANFMGQIGAESAGLTRRQESFCCAMALSESVA
jgi:putative chitinase